MVVQMEHRTEGPNFDFLTGSLETVNTSGGLSGLLMAQGIWVYGDITG